MDLNLILNQETDASISSETSPLRKPPPRLSSTLKRRESITQADLDEPLDRMHDRCQAGLEANGLFAKY